MLKEVEEINKQAMQAIVTKAKTLLKNDIKDKTIGILGLSFKPDTDDMRDAPSIVVINKLQELGAKIKAYDPIAMENAKRIFKNVEFCSDSYTAVTDVNMVIVMTEWNEFRQLDLIKMKNVMRQPILLDGRKIYDPEQAKKIGFTYRGVGR